MASAGTGCRWTPAASQWDEDLTMSDLDSNSHIDIVAVGRATGNVRIY